MPTDKEKAVCRSKTRYANDPAAQQALKRINPNRAMGKPSRVYKCQVCSGYHLTTQRKPRF